MNRVTIDTTARGMNEARLCSCVLPTGAAIVGSVRRDGGIEALVRLSSGRFVGMCGGACRTVDEAAVRRALGEPEVTDHDGQAHHEALQRPGPFTPRDSGFAPPVALGGPWRASHGATARIVVALQNTRRARGERLAAVGCRRVWPMADDTSAISRRYLRDMSIVLPMKTLAKLLDGNAPRHPEERKRINASREGARAPLRRITPQDHTRTAEIGPWR
jgi:hypothetical protein